MAGNISYIVYYGVFSENIANEILKNGFQPTTGVIGFGIYFSSDKKEV